MNHTEKYLFRQTFLPPIFNAPVDPNLGLVVTIPACGESDLITALVSINNCNLPADVGVEIIVVINHPSQYRNDWKEINENVSISAQSWALQNSTTRLRFLISDPIELPTKQAGAGLARKIAMDEACLRLQHSEVEHPIIACFDADATCSKNYLTQLVCHFKHYPNSLGCAIYFEHSLDLIVSPFIIRGIIQYELHLRYYQAAMAYADHPQALFTVGSAMAVTRNAYVAQGGMNRRKAGEDFWFMLKLMMAGEVTSLTQAAIYPSARISHRVPFGTGRAMCEMVQNRDATYLTTPFLSFLRLKEFLAMVDILYLTEWNESLFTDHYMLEFLRSVGGREAIAEIKMYTTDLNRFRKRFYRWFNVFMVMKFFHFIRDLGFPDVPVNQESLNLLDVLGITPSTVNALDILREFRVIHRR